jgi:pilus assembly protein Flp/PilA
MQCLLPPLLALLRDDDGAQVIEYALLIAVVAIALVIALRDVAGPNFVNWMTRVSGCLTGGTCA